MFINVRLLEWVMPEWQLRDVSPEIETTTLSLAWPAASLCPGTYYDAAHYTGVSDLDGQGTWGKRLKCPA